MGGALTQPDDLSSVASSTLVEAARSFAASATAAATRRAYRSDLAAFATWCAEQGVHPMPATAETVALYLTALAQEGRRASTITRASSAIAAAHLAAGVESPTTSTVVRKVLKGIRRELGTETAQKAPLLAGELRELVREHLADRPLDVRDRALLLVGFAGGLRRSELVGLDVRDVRFVDDGLELLIRRSKTDQEGVGVTIGIPFGSAPDVCPVRTLRRWIEVLEPSASGPLFRSVNRGGHVRARRLSGRDVARTVKRLVSAAGMDPDAFAGHSLRAGFITSAARAGKHERDIQRQSRHRSLTTLRGYIREGELFRDNAAEGLL